LVEERIGGIVSQPAEPGGFLQIADRIAEMEINKPLELCKFKFTHNYYLVDLSLFDRLIT